MNYRYKRLKAGITRYTMAKELGISEEKYKEVEEKKRHMEGKMLDKFMEIINRKKEINVNTTMDTHKVDEWIKSGEAKKAMEEYGYTQRQLAKELGTSQGRVSEILNGLVKGVNDNKLKLYDFLTNSLNKKYDKTKKDDEPKAEKSNKYQTWLKEHLKDELKKKNITQMKLCEGLNVTPSHLSHFLNGKSGMSEEKAEEIFNFLNNIEKPQKDDVCETKEEKHINTNEEPKTTSETPKNAVKDDDKEKDKQKTEINIKITDIKEFAELVKDLNKANKKIKRLERQIMLYEKLIERL